MFGYLFIVKINLNTSDSLFLSSILKPINQTINTNKIVLIKIEKNSLRYKSAINREDKYVSKVMIINEIKQRIITFLM